ncbi:MAG: enoyl-CoA hydratase [Deltaproteobacteria bacterium]|nr:MAG: enoyl-CoA hydratase [Deltaproteobacteria bacterium]
MNRPERRNAFNDRQYDDLRDALADAQENEEVCAVVITGAGGAFTGGQDLSEMRVVDPDGDNPHGFIPFIDRLAAFDKPLIAAVNGVAVGIGVTMLLHCDIVYVAETARLRAPFVSLGIVPEAGSSLLLPLILGPQRAAEILYTSEWLDAERAVELGLAAASFPDEELLGRALAKAHEIAEQPLAALRATKRLLLAARADALAAARRREDEVMLTRIGSPENLEAIAAFREKRKPDFRRLGK